MFYRYAASHVSAGQTAPRATGLQRANSLLFSTLFSAFRPSARNSLLQRSIFVSLRSPLTVQFTWRRGCNRQCNVERCCCADGWNSSNVSVLKPAEPDAPPPGMETWEVLGVGAGWVGLWGKVCMCVCVCYWCSVIYDPEPHIVIFYSIPCLPCTHTDPLTRVFHCLVKSQAKNWCCRPNKAILQQLPRGLAMYFSPLFLTSSSFFSSFWTFICNFYGVVVALIRQSLPLALRAQNQRCISRVPSVMIGAVEDSQSCHVEFASDALRVRRRRVCLRLLRRLFARAFLHFVSD